MYISYVQFRSGKEHCYLFIIFVIIIIIIINSNNNNITTMRGVAIKFWEVWGFWGFGIFGGFLLSFGVFLCILGFL